MDYPGIDGFLGTRASLMLDVVSVALAVLLPLLAWNIYLVRYRRAYATHKRLQLLLGAVLGVTVILFEVDMRTAGWRERAAPSPYFAGDGNGLVQYALGVHLVFAVSTALLWIWVIAQAVLQFPKPPAPSQHSRSHRLWGRVAAIDLVCTAVTGWVFYWLAFVAR